MLYPLLALALAPADITSIRIEHTECFGSCPVWDAKIMTDGKVRYHGIKYCDRMGNYTATISSDGFKRLAAMAERLHYFDLKDNYSVGVTDQPSQITTVVRKGVAKRVYVYGSGAEPDEAWAFQTLVDGVIHEAWDWKKVK